jgi:hypothetical protein
MTVLQAVQRLENACQLDENKRITAAELKNNGPEAAYRYLESLREQAPNKWSLVVPNFVLLTDIPPLTAQGRRKHPRIDESRCTLSPATSKCTTCGHFKVHHPGNVWYLV